VALGHPVSACWEYTPRQMAAYLFFARRRRRSDLAEQLGVQAMAARSEPKEIEKQIEKWTTDGA
jgi:predicted ArsR family transcriptional regulator